jgi:AhpD family alkylhydroperoxidase
LRSQHAHADERDLIATFVSASDDCFFCQNTHGAAAANRQGGNEQLVLDVKQNFESAKISPKLKALRGIAAKVQSGGKSVQPEAIERARAESSAGLGGTFRKPVSHPLP